MGLLRVTLRLANPSDSSREASVEVLVDTGAVFSFVPADLLTRLGITPIEQATFQLADSRRIERPVGEARFFYDGKQGVSKVIFAQPTDATVMGVQALESLGLEVDLLRRELRPMTLFLYSLLSRAAFSFLT